MRHRKSLHIIDKVCADWQPHWFIFRRIDVVEPDYYVSSGTGDILINESAAEEIAKRLGLCKEMSHQDSFMKYGFVWGLVINTEKWK